MQEWLHTLMIKCTMADIASQPFKKGKYFEAQYRFSFETKRILAIVHHYEKKHRFSCFFYFFW